MKNPRQKISGPVRILAEGQFAFLRTEGRLQQFQAKDKNGNTDNFNASPFDIYISKQQINDYHLEEGDIIECESRPASGNERFAVALKIFSINGTILEN